ncbi:MAG TPA: VCBS repeat-containing protein [Myxococcota bacterium]|nr:VCBS repeat-containing protein [Myxococcota bacterium]
MARAWAALTASILAGAFAPGDASAANRCAGAKLAAVSKAASCRLALEAKEARKGAPPDAAKLARCDDALAGAFAKAEARPPCLTSGDAAALGARVEGFGDDVDAALSVGLPNACQGSKLRATGKAASCLLRIRKKAAAKDAAIEPGKVAACEDNLTAAFARAERKTCGTTGDAGAAWSLAEAFVDEADEWLTPGPDPVPFARVVVDDDLPGYLDCKSVADFGGDGLADIAIGTDTQLVWYEAPDWQRSQILPGANFTTDMQAADVDGDGDPDLVVPEYDLQRVEWIPNPRVGGGDWEPQTIGTGVTAHDLEVADMSGDAKLDVVIRGHFGPTTLYLHGATPGAWTPVPIDAAIDNEGLALADIDGDGRRDIVQNGYWLEAPDDPSDGDAWQKHSFDSSWETSTVGVAVADLSGDTRPDVVLAFGESEGEMAWYEAPVDPRVGNDWVKHPIASPVDYVHTFKLADVDGDGSLDVVFAEMAQSAQKRVGFFRNGGGGLSWTLQVLSTDGSHNVRVADVGADGDLDIVGANWQQGSVVELFENLRIP